MDLNVYINGDLRTDLTVRRLSRSYVAPWRCEMAWSGRHDARPVRPGDWVIVDRADTGTRLFRGNVIKISPGGVAREGINIVAKGRRYRLENEPVNINGAGHYIWNRRGHQCKHESGEDSPGQDGGKWTAGEIIVDILEHALGIPGCPASCDSAIAGHHGSCDSAILPYLTADDITAYNAAEWLALDSVIGEFSVDNTPVAVAISELIALNGGFYGWFIDQWGVLRLIDLNACPLTDVEAGEVGHWQDEGGRSYRLLDNKLDWTLEGVYSRVMVQGADQTVEVKPSNLDGCANAALNGGGELELVAQPWKGYACAYRALDQPYRKWTWKGVGLSGSCTNWRTTCECGIPAGQGGIYSGARIYRGTDAGAKGIATSPGGYLWRVNLMTGMIGFYWDIAADLDPGEKLWGWYWARVPFTVTAGPQGNAYECFGHDRTLKVYDSAFKHTSSYPVPSMADDETAMGILAARLLEQLQDVRVQGRIECDAVDPGALHLRRRYNVTRLDRPTTTPHPETTSACWPDPLDWGRLGLNAVEVVYDFDANSTVLTLANTFYMLEDYSAVKERLRLNLFARRELALSEDIADCQVGPGSEDPDDEAEDCRGHTDKCYLLNFTGSCSGVDFSAMDVIVGPWDYYEDSGAYLCIWANVAAATVLVYDPGPQEWFIQRPVGAGMAVWKKKPGQPDGPLGQYDCVGNSGVVVVTEVECPELSTTAAPETTTTTPGDCNDCDPPLPDTIHVQICFAGGDFEGFNGDHALVRTVSAGQPCYWVVGYEGGQISLEWVANVWTVTLTVARGTSCRKRWAKDDATGCDPWAPVVLGAPNYAALDCLDDTCVDHLSCEGSTGAAVGVSVGPGACPTATSTTTAWCESCEDLAALCFWIAFNGGCDEYDYTGKASCVEWDHSEEDPEGIKCVWVGDLVAGGLTTTAPPAPDPPEDMNVELVFHPTIGWMVWHGPSCWLKRDDPLDFCDPEGWYDCVWGGIGVAVVTMALCGKCAPPTSTTGAPTTTTKAPTTTPEPPPTTTPAVPPTTTEAPPPPPSDCCCECAHWEVGGAQIPIPCNATWACVPGECAEATGDCFYDPTEGRRLGSPGVPIKKSGAECVDAGAGGVMIYEVSATTPDECSI